MLTCSWQQHAAWLAQVFSPENVSGVNNHLVLYSNISIISEVPHLILCLPAPRDDKHGKLSRGAMTLLWVVISNLLMEMSLYADSHFFTSVFRFMWSELLCFSSRGHCLCVCVCLCVNVCVCMWVILPHMAMKHFILLYLILFFSKQILLRQQLWGIDYV